MAPRNPIEHLLERCDEWERRFRSWLAGQPRVMAAANSVRHLQTWFNVELGNGRFPSWFNKEFDGGFRSWQATHRPDVLTTTMSLSSTCMGGLLGSLWSPNELLNLLSVDAMLMHTFYELMINAFGVIDVKSRHEAMFTLMSARKQPDVALDVVTNGFYCALYNGAMTLALMASFRHSMAVGYCQVNQVKSLLVDLGLEMYVKNFMNGLLTDATLPLLTDSALRDVKIPTGARLLILDHIQRDPALTKRKPCVDKLKN